MLQKSTVYKYQSKTKTVDSRCKNSLRSKIRVIINNPGIEQVAVFNYLAFNLSYINARDVDIKLATSRFQQLVLIKRILLNIMFPAPMERFQLELINCFTYFSPSSHPTMCISFP